MNSLPLHSNITETLLPVDDSVTVDLVSKPLKGKVALPLSKSLCNRALLIQGLFPPINITKLAEADDVVALKSALQKATGTIDLGAAGTAMRFATAYFAAKSGVNVTLVGSERMHNRPISELVNALRDLGAEITYLEEEGFPPLKISGKKLFGGHLKMKANVSSQFVSALLLIAPALQNGLQIELNSEVVSRPYIKMTIGLMSQFGFSVYEKENQIWVESSQNIAPSDYLPEADWSAAAYWYGMTALQEDAKLQLLGLRQNSLQGDNRLVRIFEELGVKSTFNEEGVLIENRAAQLPGKLIINLIDNPDLAQPLAFTCAALGIGADLRGLQTLRIKETDRLVAIKTELAKVGVSVVITENSLAFEGCTLHPSSSPFNTYQDHRMAMSEAILATCFPVEIKDPGVVSKSYPGFWEELKRIMDTEDL